VRRSHVGRAEGLRQDRAVRVASDPIELVFDRGDLKPALPTAIEARPDLNVDAGSESLRMIRRFCSHIRAFLISAESSSLRSRARRFVRDRRGHSLRRPIAAASVDASAWFSGEQFRDTHRVIFEYEVATFADSFS